jgi:hypothetical protein
VTHPETMRTPKVWSISLGLAGLHDCGISLYHSVLPYQMGWRRGLEGVAESVVWAVFALNFSWSVLVFLAGVLVFHAARLGPEAGTFARRTVFTVGLFWAIHGAYTWIHPLPLPPSLRALKYFLLAFPVVAVFLHWWPLFTYRQRRVS